MRQRILFVTQSDNNTPKTNCPKIPFLTPRIWRPLKILPPKWRNSRPEQSSTIVHYFAPIDYTAAEISKNFKTSNFWGTTGATATYYTFLESSFHLQHLRCTDSTPLSWTVQNYKASLLTILKKYAIMQHIFLYNVLPWGLPSHVIHF